MVMVVHAELLVQAGSFAKENRITRKKLHVGPCP